MSNPGSPVSSSNMDIVAPLLQMFSGLSAQLNAMSTQLNNMESRMNAIENHTATPPDVRRTASPPLPVTPVVNPQVPQVIDTRFTNPIQETLIRNIDENVHLPTDLMRGVINGRPSNRDVEDLNAGDFVTQRRDSLTHSLRIPNHGSIAQPDLRENTIVQVTRAQPDFSHIKLDKLNVRAVFEFFQNIAQYRTMHNIELHAATLVDKSVRTQVLARVPEIGCHEKFFDLTLIDLYRALQRSVRPEDKLSFYKLLDNGTFFYSNPNYAMTVLNFQDFYNRLMTYRREFGDVLDFLKFDNAKNVPPMNNQDYGIVKLFCSKDNTGYLSRVVQQLGVNKFDTYDSFCTMLFDVVRVHYDISGEARKLYAFMPPIATRSSQVQNNVSRKFPQRLSHVSQAQYVVNDEVEVLNPNNEVKPDLDDFDDPDVVLDLNDDPNCIPNDISDSFSNHDDDDPYRKLSVVLAPRGSGTLYEPYKQKPEAQTICYKMLYEGICPNPSCPYSHDPKVLEAHALKVESKLRNRAWTMKPPLDTKRVQFGKASGNTKTVSQT